MHWAAPSSRPGAASRPTALGGQPAALLEELDAALHRRSAAEWAHDLQTSGLPCGPVNDIGQAVGLAEKLGLSPIVRLPAGTGFIAGLANRLTLHRTPVQYHRAPPELGADNDQVKAWLRSDDEPMPS
jgi:crotonobetainyl-CoA:carnitine CoA-transferase CaiB-like acyl-CoA transferase